MKPVTAEDLAQLFHLSMDMLSIVRANGTFKHVNASWTSVLGWTAEELVNAPYMNFVHPDDHEATIREAERLAGGARTIDFENRYRAKDGTVRWLSWRVTPSSDGQLLYCATRDVTEARRTRDALAHARRDIQAILDHSPIIVFVTDVDGRYRLLNSASQTVTGHPPEQLIGKTAADLFPADIADQLRANTQQVIAKRDAITFEETLPSPDGMRVYSVVRFPLFDGDGNITAICGMSQDVTAQKAAAEAVQHARTEAVRANRAKSDFLSRMSHELRTPLNAILGFTQLFERERMNEDERENVRHILEGGRHLLDLINEVIDISRVESGTLALSNEPVEVKEAIDSAVNLIRPLAGANGITLLVEPVNDGLAVLADRQRFRQVLLNLLSNAVKYNRANGSIRVTVERRPVERVRISVHDTGAGIPPQLLSQLFQPFERLGAEKSAVEGTGLGLALSRALCEAMGGTLAVQSVVDRGSTFTVELGETALAQTPTLVQLPPPVQGTTGAEHSALLVYIEDNAANVKLMQRILSRRPGVRMTHAGDGRSGIEMVRRQTPDMVLLDLQLPEMSGEAVLHELWRDPLTRRIPIVVLTADATRGLPQRLTSAGARACLTKPLDVQQVLRTIDDLLAGERSAANG